MAYNWCWWLRNYFDITVLYCTGDPTRLSKMRKLVKLEKYEQGKEYKCDIFIRNSVWGTIPINIKAKRKIEMRHANYKYLLERNLLYLQYKDMGIKEIVGCGEFVSKMSNEVLHDNPTTIKNILLPRNKTEKILKLISCMRIDSAKGWNRMLKLMEMMRKNNIKFEWNIFTNNPQKCQYEEVHFYKQRYDIWDYLANADYTVLLSDMEGFPYTVQESLQYQVPCIVTDVGGCTELIKDGENGYVVPLDMNFDVNKIKNIPKCKEYKNNALEDWLKFLEYDGEILDEEEIIKNFKEEKEMKYLVEATGKYTKTNTSDSQLAVAKGMDRYVPKEGEQWEVEAERKDILVERGFVKLIQNITEQTTKETTEEETEPIKEKRKPNTRRTRKAK